MADWQGIWTWTAADVTTRGSFSVHGAYDRRHRKKVTEMSRNIAGSRSSASVRSLVLSMHEVNINIDQGRLLT